MAIAIDPTECIRRKDRPTRGFQIRLICTKIRENNALISIYLSIALVMELMAI